MHQELTIYGYENKTSSEQFSSLSFAAGKAFFLAVALSLVFTVQVNIICLQLQAQGVE